MTDPENPVLLAYGQALADPAARRELRGWCGLGLAALAVAGVFALLLALSRTPGVADAVPWPLAFFRKGLVVHVVFAFIVWFLAVLGAVTQLAAWRLAGGRPPLAKAGLVGLVLAAAACVLLFLPAFLDRGEPTLNNYVPAIIDPLYYAGLGVLAAGLSLPVARLLAVRLSAANPPDGLAAAGLGAAVVFCLALACFGLAYRALAGAAPSHAFNEELFWGGGHLLQFISTILMLGAWSALAGLTLGDGAPPDRLVRGAVVFLIACALPAPVFYFVFPPFAAEQTRAFSGLLWALGPPAVAVAWGVLAAARRRRRAQGGLPWGDPLFLCLALSIGVFAVGGVLGMFIDGADTRTPAHYHGVIAGVTLAFFGLFLGLFLPLIGRAPRLGRLVRGLVIAFAAGQTAACLGLFVAGGYGAPRKVAGAAQGLHDLGAVLGMGLNGLGALIAVIGGVLFIAVAARALLGRAAAK